MLLDCSHDFILQNFLFTTKDENAPMKIIDFGLSDFIRPGALLVEFQFLNALIETMY